MNWTCREGSGSHFCEAWGPIAMLNGADFISGVWCGGIFGAAAMLLIVSLALEHSQRKHARDLHRVRKMWQ